MHITWMPASKALHGSYFARPSFSPLSFPEFSRFPLCRGAHINSGAGGAKWCRERSTACFLIFTLFLNFCSFRPFLHTCPAMPCHLRLSSNLLFLHSIIATSRWHKKISKLIMWISKIICALFILGVSLTEAQKNNNKGNDSYTDEDMGTC